MRTKKTTKTAEAQPQQPAPAAASASQPTLSAPPEKQPQQQCC